MASLKSSIFNRLTQENENASTEMLANLMKRKYLRTLILSWLVPELTKEMLDDKVLISTQRTIMEGGRPDLCIEGSDFRILVENKILIGTTPTPAELTSYIDNISNSDKKICRLIYLVPKQYKYIDQFEAISSKHQEKVYVKHWEDLLVFLDKAEVADDSSLVEASLEYLKSLIELSVEAFSEELNPKEVAMLYETDLLFDCMSLLSKLQTRIAESRDELVRRLNVQFENRLNFSLGETQHNIYGYGQYIMVGGEGQLFYGISPVSSNRDIRRKYGFSVAVLSSTPNLEADRMDNFKDDEGWYYFPLDKRALLEDDNSRLIESLLDIVKTVLQV